MKKLNIIVNIIFALMVVSILGYGMKKVKKREYKASSYHFQILEDKSEISALYSDGRHVYVGTNEGLKVYDPITKTIVSEIKSIKMIYTASIVGDGEGGVWIGHEEGLTHLQSNGSKVSFQYPQVPKGRVNTIALKNHEIYCGTYNGAAKLVEKKGNWEVENVLNKKTGLLSDSVNVILPTEQGLLFGSYLDSQGGITYISDDGDISYLGKNTGLTHPYVTSIVRDTDGKIWIGTGYMKEGGLVQVILNDGKPQIINKYSVEDGLPGEKVRYLFVDDYSLWVTTEYDGVLIKRRNHNFDWMDSKNIYLSKETGLSDNEIKCIIKVNKEYWLGGKYGLTIVPEDMMK
jgi:sll0241 protein